MRWLSIIYFKQEVEDLNPFVNIFFSQFSGGGGGGGGVACSFDKWGRGKTRYFFNKLKFIFFH